MKNPKGIIKEEYDSVLQLIKKQNVRLDCLHVQDDKVVMQGAAPKRRAVDSSFSDLSGRHFRRLEYPRSRS
jgi:hypothetical protein